MHRHFPLMARMGVYFGRKDTVLEIVIQSTEQIGIFQMPQFSKNNNKWNPEQVRPSNWTFQPLQVEVTNNLVCIVFDLLKLLISEIEAILTHLSSWVCLMKIIVWAYFHYSWLMKLHFQMGLGWSWLLLLQREPNHFHLMIDHCDQCFFDRRLLTVKLSEQNFTYLA